MVRSRNENSGLIQDGRQFDLPTAPSAVPSTEPNGVAQSDSQALAPASNSFLLSSAEVPGGLGSSP